MKYSILNLFFSFYNFYSGFTVFYFLIIFILSSRKIFKIILNHIDYPITMTSPIVYDVNLESHEKNYCDI